MSAPADVERFATTDQARWLTELDRAADAMFREQVADGYHVDACRSLLHHLTHTERVRAGLVLEDGPVYGTGPPPDLELAWASVQVATRTSLPRLEELMAP
jgi:hypothetical protein